MDRQSGIVVVRNPICTVCMCSYDDDDVGIESEPNFVTRGMNEEKKVHDARACAAPGLPVLAGAVLSSSSSSRLGARSV